MDIYRVWNISNKETEDNAYELKATSPKFAALNFVREDPDDNIDEIYDALGDDSITFRVRSDSGGDATYHEVVREYPDPVYEYRVRASKPPKVETSAGES